MATKLFTGFVYDPVVAAAPAQANPVVDEHVAEQMAALRKLPADTPLWLAEPVRFQCEWRYYVDARGRILAQARYDADGADDAPLPTGEVVRCAIDALVAHLVAHGDPHPFALDMGVLENGRTACVEVNDGWAIGLNGHARTPGGMAWSARGYVEFLLERWHAVVRQSRRRKGERIAVEPEDEEDEPGRANSAGRHGARSRSNRRTALTPSESS
ncbi:ATP-grasp domain-containing protein [Variovorax gossypii]